MSEEWPRVRNGPRISRGQTHSLQVTFCLVSEEWPRVGNGLGSEIRNNPSSLVEKNGADSLLLIFYVDGRHFGKASIQDERVCVLKLELMETTSLLKKKEMTPRLGGSTDVLLIDGYDEHILSSSESGLRFLTDKHFSVRKMAQIVDVR